MTTNYPIQLIAPSIELSPYDRIYMMDIKGALEYWRGEQRIWLSPEIEKVVRWQRESLVPECIVPARRNNRIDIYHIDRDRRISPPPPVKKWKKGLPSAIYKNFVNSTVKSAAFSPQLTLSWPVIKNGAFSHYIKRKFKANLPPMVPADYDPASNSLKLKWDWPELSPVKLESPETESKDIYGAVEFERNAEGKETDTAISRGEKQARGIPIQYKWEKPFDKLFPYGCGVDVLRYRDLMLAQFQNINKGYYDHAIHIAHTTVKHFVTEIALPKMLVDFLPAYSIASSDKTLKGFIIEYGERYKVESDSLQEITSSPDFKRDMNKPTTAYRILGWLGYCWWEFCRDITEYRFVGICNNCGKAISGGHMDRQYCTREENPVCFREQDTRRQRKRRHLLKQQTKNKKR